MAGNFYISFGGASPLGNHLVEVEAKDIFEAQLYANRHFKSTIWCAVYHMPEAMKMARDYDLTIIKAKQ